MALPVIRPRGGYLFLAVVIAHIVLISAQVNTRTGVPVLQSAVFAVIAEVQQAASAVVDGVSSRWRGYVALRGVREENARLRQKNADLMVEAQQLSAAVAESRELHRLLDLRAHLLVNVVGADVVGSSAAPDFRTVTIDRGSSDGVSKDMAVLAPEGVVGRVVQEVGQSVAKVQLLIDRNAAAGVLIEPSRAQGIVLGNGGGMLTLEFVSATAAVKEGDLVRTAGNDGIYPKGLVVGRVEGIRRSGAAFVSSGVRPAVDFSRLEHVLVVIGTKPASKLIEGPS